MRLCGSIFILGLTLHLAVLYPTLDDVTEAKCPSDKPYKCLKYGLCYNYTQYCDEKNHIVESCFPYSLSNSTLLKWCRKSEVNTSLLPHGACKHACYDYFGKDKYLFQDNGDDSASDTTLSTTSFIPQTEQVTAAQHTTKDEDKNAQNGWMGAFFFLLGLNVAYIVGFIWWKKRTRSTKFPFHQGLRKPPSKYKDDDDDDKQCRTAPEDHGANDAVDSRETDITFHLPFGNINDVSSQRHTETIIDLDSTPTFESSDSGNSSGASSPRDIPAQEIDDQITVRVIQRGSILE